MEVGWTCFDHQQRYAMRLGYTTTTYTIRSAPVDNMFDIRIKVKLCRHWRK
jgi:hypothetical protein